MRKTVAFIMSFVLLGFINIACDSGKSVQEYIREERKAIERYLLTQNIEVLNEYPQNRVFDLEKNQYYKTSEGLYMQVVDSGNSRRVQTYDEVLIRFDYLYYIKSYVSGSTDSIVVSYMYFPIEFRYGISYSTDPTGLACSGFAIPLTYVGEGAVLNLIIPSELGNSTDNGSFAPVFYRNLKYTKFR